ncbi:MAG TPA: Na+/H+ antiporter NhaA [Solirubrobacteraceae bacterium]|nr:Na+/H+ antiporter NhaA [Solirubrobacteraceae bacterium]
MEAAVSAPAGRTAWARNLGAPVRDYLRTETGSALVLIGAALAALVWANSPWPDSYESFWSTKLALTVGDHALSADLRDWVNKGLMTLFFLVVGLEAKRELDLGELRERTRIGIPVMAALGGMALPVLLYLAINAGGSGAHGWGAAMSTDTALALGTLALVGPHWATRLRVFLLTLVVIDDLGALLVIAVVYTKHVSLGALAIALVLFGVLVSLRFAGRWRAQAAVVVGLGVWLALFKSGIDPVIAGLAIGLVTSAYPPERERLERATELTRSFREQPTPELAYSAQRGLTSAISANERLQYRLHPWTSFVIVPLFALANAGIHLDGGLLSDALSSPVTIGVLVAYVVGKPLGIMAAAWLGTRRSLGGTKLAVTWPGLAGTGAAAGVGFTVSLLIAGLAFNGRVLDQAKLGVLAAAILSPLVAWAVFAVLARLPAAMRARQLGQTIEQIVDLSDDVDPEIDHIRGRHDATVTLIEYGDFECPYCGQAEPIIRELLTAHDDDLRFVFRHLPLNDVHPHAQIAAEAAEAASAQGVFWEMYDLLLSHQGELTLGDLKRYAQQLELDVERFLDEVRHHHHASRINADVASADASGVSGTPSFFINGRRHQGVYDVQTLTRAVKAARATQRAARSSRQ